MSRLTLSTLFTALTIAALSVVAACDAAPPPTAVDLDHPTAVPTTTAALQAAALQAAPQGSEVVVDLAVTGNSRGWWVARSDGTLRAEGSARSLHLELDGARLVAITTTRDGRALYALTDDAAVHVPSADRRFPQPSEWIPAIDEWIPPHSEWIPPHGEWTPIDLAVGPGDRSAWMLFAPVGDSGTGRLFHLADRTATEWPSSSAPVAMAITRDGGGVWLLDRNGDVIPFGSAPDLGAIPNPDGWEPADVASTRSGKGLWLLGDDGVVLTVGDANHHGDLAPGAQAVALEPTPSGRGYRILDSTGSVTGFGDAVRTTGRPGCDPFQDKQC